MLKFHITHSATDGLINYHTLLLMIRPYLGEIPSTPDLVFNSCPSCFLLGLVLSLDGRCAAGPQARQTLKTRATGNAF